MVLNFLTWIYYLQHENLTTATAITSLVYLAIPLSAWAILGEKLTSGMLLGFLFIIIGVTTVAFHT